MVGNDHVFPAHAGMFLSSESSKQSICCFPRARGDVPFSNWDSVLKIRFSPRTRGCSVTVTIPATLEDVFPAHAGMFLMASAPACTCQCFPRARGDVPGMRWRLNISGRFSPRTRGCSSGCVGRCPVVYVFPAHAGMFLGVTTTRPETCPFSPRTRGCSAATRIGKFEGTVFPAHAGMFRHRGVVGHRGRGFPRARGDVPHALVIIISMKVFSPRTRGCSSRPRNHHQHEGVFPAHAGMFRIRVGVCGHPNRFPRARGDVPRKHLMVARLRRFSPRTRGCSGGYQPAPYTGPVFPAHAGMFLPWQTRNCASMSFPRARGDVPDFGKGSLFTVEFSPRTRGCS